MWCFRILLHDCKWTKDTGWWQGGLKWPPGWRGCQSLGSPCDITAGGFPRTQELRDSEKKRKRWLTLLYPGEIKATHRDHCYTTLAKWILHNMGPLGESSVIFLCQDLSQRAPIYSFSHRHRERMQTTHIHTRNCDVFSHLLEQSWAQWKEHRRGDMKKKSQAGR